MNIIRLFVASSNELADFRSKIDTWVAHKNRVLDERGYHVRVEVDKWEFESTAIPTSGRSQDEYNKLIERADVVAVLIKNKVGDFTEEEFVKAVELFNKTGKPRVFVYTLPVEKTKVEPSLKKFLDGLYKPKEDLKYFYAKADNYDALWNMINNELDRPIDSSMFFSSIVYSHPIAIPIQLERCLRISGYHATTLNKEDKNGQVIEENIKADDFFSQVLLEVVNKNSVIITGEGGSGKSTLLARFFESAKEKAKLFYVPINELDYGLDEKRRVSISDYLFRKYFKKPHCKTADDVFKFINDLDDAIFILDGYNELERHYTAEGGFGERSDLLDNDIEDLQKSCNGRIIISSRDEVVNKRSHFVLYRLQRVNEEVVGHFLDEREELLTKKEYRSEGERNDLIKNLKTPILLNAFDEVIHSELTRSNDEIINGISLGMFERPTNKGQIFYNYLCCEMFKNRDIHKYDTAKYAIRGLLFLKYVVPFMARKSYESNRTYITQEDIQREVETFLKDFNKQYVESGVFDDLNAIVRRYRSSNLSKCVALDIDDDGNLALDVLVHNYHILKTERSLDGGHTQRYSFEHPILGEVLAILDIWNQMAMQNENPDFNIYNDILAKPLSFDVKELLADFCATKEN